MSDFASKSGYVYFTNRRFIVVDPAGNGQWNWRYVNGNGFPISEGTVSADTVTQALEAAAEDAEVSEHLHG